MLRFGFGTRPKIQCQSVIVHHRPFRDIAAGFAKVARQGSIVQSAHKGSDFLERSRHRNTDIAIQTLFLETCSAVGSTRYGLIDDKEVSRYGAIQTYYSGVISCSKIRSLFIVVLGIG